MRQRDAAKAITVLTSMLEFFDGGKRWTRKTFADDQGNRCLIGAIELVTNKKLSTHLIEDHPVFHYLDAALPQLCLTPFSLIDYNDKSRSFKRIHDLIVKAHALAQAELDEAHDRRRRRSALCHHPVTARSEP